MNNRFQTGVGFVSITASILCLAWVFSLSSEVKRLKSSANIGIFEEIKTPDKSERLLSVEEIVSIVDTAVVQVVVTAADGNTTTEGQGSGFFISADGKIVTNFHIIEDADTITIETKDKGEYKAKIVGMDPKTDLALLETEIDDDFNFVKFDFEKTVQVGEKVIAIGNPFGIGQSTSVGVISAVGRDRIESGAYVDYIQTDASVNRGGSGGPLFDMKGNVIGINSAIFSPTGASVGIAFTIPAKSASEVIEQLRVYGKITRGYLGFGLRTADFERTQDGEWVKTDSGAIISYILPGSAAQASGLKIDDIIIMINGIEIRDSLSAVRLIASIKPGTEVKLLAERNDEIKEFIAEIGVGPEKEESPNDVGLKTSTEEFADVYFLIDLLGLELIDTAQEFRETYLPKKYQGALYIQGVDLDGLLADDAIDKGSLLLSVNGKPVTTVETLSTLLKTGPIPKNKRMTLKLLDVLGNEKTVYFTLP